MLLVVVNTTTSICVNATSDSLKPGDTVTYKSKLCSKQGKNQPVDVKSAVLSLAYSGALKIESQNRKPIIIYLSTQPTNNTVATMLDTGNLVIQQLHPNGTMTLATMDGDELARPVNVDAVKKYFV
ncbi:Serine/Threonine-kinase, putative [Medicago truncatula]|uniref:Serine/Threonine-kinase, putative n=1 Tax=Medicago truncatula TaxID=3880 RepID=G7LA19_MEDTR|nr:Serine/Threonine-kinase, putative [Medicago truncatula]